jgi:glycosyltransferase involved in cell wall biosynthesis
MRNTGIITSPFAVKASVPPLSHIIDIFSVMSSELYVLTGKEGLAAIKSQNTNVKGYLIGNTYQSGFLIQIIQFIFANMKICFQILKLSRRVKIWAFFLGEKNLVIPMIFGKILRKKTVFIASDTLATLPLEQPMSPLARWMTNIFKKVNMHLATRIVVYASNLVSPSDLTKFKLKIRIASEHFLDLEHFQILDDYRQRDNRIGYIARLSKEKGILTFMDTIRLILKEKKEIKFLIAGDGALKDQVRKLSEKPDDNVEYLGWVNHSDLPPILNSLKLLVLPSHNEGLPNIILEAMACGTPVLATPIGAIVNLIKDSENGYIIKDNSPEYSASRILQILKAQDLEQISRAGRTLVEKEYTFEKAVERYRGIIDEL